MSVQSWSAWPLANSAISTARPGGTELLAAGRIYPWLHRPGARPRHNGGMNIVILDDYQDAVRKLHCASRLDAYAAKVYTNTVKGLGQLAVRLRDADIIVLIRERTHITRQLVEKLPRLKLIAQTGRIGAHIDVAACTERGIAVAEGQLAGVLVGRALAQGQLQQPALGPKAQ